MPSLFYQPLSCLLTSTSTGTREDTMKTGCILTYQHFLFLQAATPIQRLLITTFFLRIHTTAVSLQILGN